MFKLNNKHSYLIILLYFLCLTNCTDKGLSDIDTDFPMSSVIMSADSINLEEKGLLLPFSVSYIDSCFIFSNIRIKDRLSIWNQKTNEVINTAHIGNGPNEIIQYLPVSNNMSEFLFADRIKGKIFKLDLNSYEYKEIIQINESINRFYSLAMLDSTSIIGTGMFEQGRFLIYNIADSTYVYEDEYSSNKDIQPLQPYQKAALYAGTLIGVHPDKNKFVAAYKGLIDFYNIDESYNLSPSAHRYYHFPQFAIPEEGPVIAHKKEEAVGFLSLSYDSSYVYLLYSGSSLLDKGSSAYTGNIILVYNWEGMPVKRYVLNHSVISIHINNNMLWCIGENHKYLYKYALSL